MPARLMCVRFKNSFRQELSHAELFVDDPFPYHDVYFSDYFNYFDVGSPRNIVSGVVRHVMPRF